MDCIKNNIEIIKRQNNFICIYKMAYNNTCNSINTGYFRLFVSFKKESKIIKYTYTKQHKHSNPVPVLLSNYYFLYKVIYNPAILFIPTNPNSDYALMYGSLASTITGGNFLEGDEIGLVVTALNHALHEALDPDPTQQQELNEKKVKTVVLENKVWDLDGDGRLSLNEANRLTKILPNDPNIKYEINIDIKKIDLSGVFREDIENISPKNHKSINLFFRNGKDGNVFGNLTFVNKGNGTLGIYQDSYDFKLHNPWNIENSLRNINTFFGKIYNGANGGTPFYININGYIIINSLKNRPIQGALH